VTATGGRCARGSDWPLKRYGLREGVLSKTFR
jgi:hypothetical protein